MTDTSMIHPVAIPDDLTEWCKAQGFAQVLVHVSEIAVSITVSPEPTSDLLSSAGEPREPDRLKDTLSHLVTVLREATHQAWVDVPVVVILDVVAIATTDERWVNVWRHLARLALDQDWHRGDASFYLAPPVLPSRLDDWAGPGDAAEVRRELLGPGPSNWELPQQTTVGLGQISAALGAIAFEAAAIEDDPQEALIARIAEEARQLVDALESGDELRRVPLRPGEDAAQRPAQALGVWLDGLTREVGDE